MNCLRFPVAALAAFAAIALAGCGGKPGTPEAQIRALIARAVTAAEEKDIGSLRDMVSERYSDDQGRSKRTIEDILRLHFLRNESLHLYTRVQSITLGQADRAQARVLVAMAGVPISSELELPALRADLHRFDLDFVREDDHWRVRRASWGRAEPGEFVSP